MKRILIIEREYGCGAGLIAEKAAQRLGWRLYDRDLTTEIARLAKMDPADCERFEERKDSWLYRLGKTFWRGSYETSLALHGPEVLDADRMLELVRQVVNRAAEEGKCVIVGRGAPYFLRNRTDTCSAFLFGPRHLKIERIHERLGPRADAEHLVDSVDQSRAAFIKHYFGKDWPNRHLYHVMINTVIGVNSTVDLLLHAMEQLETIGSTEVDME